MNKKVLLHSFVTLTSAIALFLAGCNSSVNLDPKDSSTEADRWQGSDFVEGDSRQGGGSDGAGGMDSVPEVAADVVEVSAPDLLPDLGPDLIDDVALDLLEDSTPDGAVDVLFDAVEDATEADLFEEADAGTPAEVVEFWGILGQNGGNHIVRFDWGDPNSLALVKATPYILLTELEFDAQGNLWAWQCNNGYNGGNLHLVDQETGDFTLVGSSNAALDDLAWNPVSGKMYGVYPGISMVSGSTELYTVNLQTGQTTLGGDIVDNGPDPLNWMSGLGIASDGSFYYYNNTNSFEGTEQGIWKSVSPDDPLQVEFLHEFYQVLGEPMGAFQIGPVFVDWSRDDVGYAVVRYQPAGSTTHTYHIRFTDSEILSATKHTLQSFGILWSVTRKPDTNGQ
mgnify:CR=1 FL=1